MAFSDQLPNGKFDVAILDLMSRIKSCPEYIHTVKQLLQFITYPIIEYLQTEGLYGVYVVVDKGSPPVKQLQCHGKRDKDNEPMPDDTPLDLEDELPQPWKNFIANRKLVRTKLYPLIFDAIINSEDYVPLGYRQWVVVDGLPSAESQDTRHNTWIRERRGNESIRQALPRLNNAILEADTGVLFFLDEHRQPHKATDGSLVPQRIIIHMNDGDIIPIALLNSFDRMSTETGTFLNEVYLCLPGNPDHTYVNVNLLFALIQEDQQMKQCAVQNPVLTICCLIALAGNDFVVDYCKGLSKAWIDASKKKSARLGVVWDTFFKQAKTFSHVFQWQVAVPGLHRKIRLPVFDEHGFKTFTYACYAAMYKDRVVKKHGQLTLNTLRLYCSQLKSDGYAIPHSNKLRRILRWVEWNMVYWLNSHRPNCEGFIDPYQLHEGASYYGFAKDPSSNKCAHARVLASARKADDNYTQHWRKRKTNDNDNSSKRIKTATK